MKKLMLMLALSLAMFGCDDSSSGSDCGSCAAWEQCNDDSGKCEVKTDKCIDNSNCSDRSDGKTACGGDDEHTCVCPDDAHLDGDSCVANSKEVDCAAPDTLPENGEAIVASVTVTWDGEKFSDPATCDWKCKADFTKTGDACVAGYTDPCADTNPCTDTNKTVCTDVDTDGVAECGCDADYHDEDGSCVANTKDVACVPSTTLPDNAEDIAASVTVTWDGSKWSDAAACDWKCKTGFTKDGDSCKEGYTDPCADTNPCTDTNKTVCSDVDTDGVAECACDAGYHDESGSCVPDATDLCKDVTCTENSTCNAATGMCDCNADFHKEDNACVADTKMVDCDASSTPENATATVEQVEVTWADGSWSAAAVCNFTCNESFHLEESACVADTKMVDCDASATPENATATVEQVEVTWADGSWSAATACAFDCNAGYNLMNGACVAVGECVGLSVENIDAVAGKSNWYQGTDGDYTVNVEFYENAATAGTYNLGEGVNTNYGTCEQCVLVENGDKKYFQSEGTLTITAGDGLVDGESAGSITSVKLVESIINIIDNTSSPVENGGCLEIETASWNTMCTEGEKRCREGQVQTCNSDAGWDTTADCATSGDVCNPETFTCEASACEDGEKRCTADGKSQLCDADGNWTLVEDCAASDKVCNGTTFACDEQSTCVDSGNNSWESATPVADSASGELCGTEDADWFSVEIPAGETFTFTVDPGSMFVDLFYADGSVEGTISNNEGVLAFTNTGETATYLVKVYLLGASHADTAYSYTSSVTGGCMNSGNNTLETATAMDLDSTNSGELCESEKDWYSVTIPAGGTLTVNYTTYGTGFFDLRTSTGAMALADDESGTLVYTNDGEAAVFYLQVNYGEGAYSFSASVAVDCTEDDMRCGTNGVETCVMGKWTLTENCSTDDKTCDDQTFTCTCENSTKRCSSDVLEICADGDWTTDTDCAANGETCNSETLVCEVVSTCVDSGNNTYNDAVAMNLGSLTEASLCSSEENDWYSVVVPAGATFEALVDGGVFFDLFDSADMGSPVSYDIGGVLAYKNEGDTTSTYLMRVYDGMGENTDLDYSFLPTVTEAAVCTDGDAACDGDLLSVCTAGQWVVTDCALVGRTCNATAKACETSGATTCPSGNNAQADALAMVLGQEESGKLCLTESADWFSVEVPAGATLNVAYTYSTYLDDSIFFDFRSEAGGSLGSGTNGIGSGSYSYENTGSDAMMVYLKINGFDYTNFEAIESDYTFTATLENATLCTSGEKMCDADVLKTCVAGAWVSTDCAANGETCNADTLVCEVAGSTCTGLSLGSLYLNPEGGVFLKGTDGDYMMTVEFLASTPVGDYDLADSNYATCEQCVIVEEGATGKYFFQRSGTLSVTTGDARVGTSVGSLVSVVLEEVTIGTGYVSTPVVDGGCLEVETVAWDTRCTEGEQRCNGNELEACGADGFWALTEDCGASGATCNSDTFSCDAGSGCIPSDNSDSSNAEVLVGDGSEVTGSLCETTLEADGDFYTFTLAAGETLTLSITEGSDYSFDIFTTTGGYVTELEGTDPTFAIEGTYFLMINDFYDVGLPGDYAFTATITDGGSGSTCEASGNNSYTDAIPMVLAQENTGTLCTTEADDWYSVTIPAGQYIVIEPISGAWFDLFDETANNTLAIDNGTRLYYENATGSDQNALLRVYQFGSTDKDYSFTPNISVK